MVACLLEKLACAICILAERKPSWTRNQDENIAGHEEVVNEQKNDDDSALHKTFEYTPILLLCRFVVASRAKFEQASDPQS